MKYDDNKFAIPPVDTQKFLTLERSYYKPMRNYLLILFSLAFFGLRSQIICTDIIPDQVCTGNNTLNIDMDNDLTPDFRITSAQAGPLGFVVVQGGQIGVNNFVLTNGSGDTQALPMAVPVNSNSMS